MTTKQKRHKKSYCQHYADYRPMTTVQRLKKLQRETDKKYVDLKLNLDQLDAVKKCGSLVPYPWYYSVRTRYFSNIKHVKSRVLKDLHYAYMHGKKNLTLNMSHYTQKDLNVLTSLGIKYSVCKYRVFL